MILNHYRSVLFVLGCAGFALSAWNGNRDVCPGCQASPVRLALPDGTPIRGRLYLPPQPLANLPAVVVCHGYLANLAFMELPWAADLTHLGLAVLFLDRRGHGRSGGALWPQADTSDALSDREPDVAAAISYLRTRAPLIDPARIAILGHSDGGTAAITAASADWDVRATVAVSASVAPFQFVNHVAPRNLLLVYGADDRFVLDYTDRLLISHATRGYLDGPGVIGDLADGSARRLLRVAGRGHLDVLASAPARRATLKWLRRALSVNRQPAADVRAPRRLRGSEPASARWAWVFVGVAALAALLTSLGAASVTNRPAGAACSQSAVIALPFAGWAGGLLVAPRLARALSRLPSQEGPVIGAMLIGPALGLVVCATIAWAVKVSLGARGARAVTATGHGNATLQPRACALALLRAAGLSTGLFVATHVLLLHHYEVSLHGARVLLLVFFAALAAPLFLFLEKWLRPCPRSVAVAALLFLAGITAVISSLLFERMAVLPGYALASVLVVAGLQRTVGGTGLESAMFGALTTGWLNAVTCALY